MAMAEPLITTGSNAPPRTFVDAANELAKIEAAGGRLPAALALLNRALAVAQQQAARESSDLVGGRVLLPRVYGALTVVHELSGQPAEAARWRDSTLAAWNELSTKKGFTVVHRSEMQAFQQSSAAR
jgi:hypothetical protein